MTRRYKLVSYTLIVGLLVMVSAVILSSRNGSDEPEKTVPTVDHEKLVADYQKEVRLALAGYSAIAAKENFNAEEIREVENNFLAIKGVPAEYRDLHARLFFALAQIENSLASGDLKALEDGRNKIVEAKAANAWLK